MAYYTIDEIIDKFSQFLVSKGIKPRGLTAYTSPIRQTLQKYLQKNDKLALQESDLFEIIPFLEEETDLRQQLFYRYNNIKKALEYFLQFADFLNQIASSEEEAMANYKVITADGIYHAKELKRHDTGLIYVKTIKDEEILLSPNSVKIIFVYNR